MSEVYVLMRSSASRLLVAGVLVLVAALALPASAADDPTPVDPSLLSALKWRNIGPANTGGRVDDFAVARVPGAPDAIYVATASGGIFKSTNQGTSWTPVLDRVDAMMSIGDVAVAPSNPNIVWAGTGEANNRQSSSWGDGVYRSVDAGRTWQHMGLKETRHVGRIVIDPKNSEIVYVAAVGHLWGSNPERGVFKTSDGGRTWTKVLFVDENTGATDLVMDPRDPQTLYAAMYQRQRKAWGFDGGGPGSGIYRTRDGGASWTRLTNGLPQGDKGRIGLDVFAGDGRIVYAIVEAGGRQSGLYRTTDGGDTWEQLGSLNPRPMYYSQVRVDPKDRQRVYLLGSNRGFYVSDDGGKSFRDVFSTVHSEDHALWIDPDDPNHLIVGGDGGVSISWDRGETWLFRDNLAIGQFYEISADMRDPYDVCGGLQDNGLWCVPSATRLRTGISNGDAYNIGGGDGFHAAVDPTDPNTIYIESQEGRATRVTLPTLERQAIAPRPPQRLRRGDRERWNWNAPLLVSSFDPAVVYMGSDVLFRSADRGATWTAISPDLTANVDRETLQMMGGPVPPDALSRHDGQTSYSTLTTISESPRDAKVLYTGSDDGQVQVTRDGGANWTNVTSNIPGLPPRTYVSSVLASRYAAGRVYATFDGHYNDDYRPYVFVSDDYGRTWRSIAAGLPETSVHRLREHPRNPRLLVIGHERGLHVSFDGGATWTRLDGNLPNVPVDDLLFHPRDNDLIVGTHGRSIWILDDVSGLEALTPEVLTSDAFLVPPPAARELSIYNPQAWYGAGQFFAPNPPFGANLTYYLRQAASGSVTIEIRDAEGTAVRTLDGTGQRGLNRITWDLRMEPPFGEGAPEISLGPNAPPSGPRVFPGTYTVVLKTHGRELTRELRVEADPRVTVSESDRRERYAALMTLYDLQRALGRSRTALRAVVSETAAVRHDLSSSSDHRRAGSDGVGRVDQLAEHTTRLLGAIASELSAANSLSRAIDGYSGRPTADQDRQLDWTFQDGTRSVDEVNHVLQNELPALYAELAASSSTRAVARAGGVGHADPIPAPVRRH